MAGRNSWGSGISACRHIAHLHHRARVAECVWPGRLVSVAARAMQRICQGDILRLPTVVLAQVVRDVVIPRADLSGVYHVAAQPISKYDLLKLIAEVYGKVIEIIPEDKLVIDRSLNAERFRRLQATWPRAGRS